MLEGRPSWAAKFDHQALAPSVCIILVTLTNKYLQRHGHEVRPYMRTLAQPSSRRRRCGGVPTSILERLRPEGQARYAGLARGGGGEHGWIMSKAAKREFNVIVERDEEGYYVASVPELPGCHTQARSLDKLMVRVREAVELCLEVERDSGKRNEFIGVQRIAV